MSSTIFLETDRMRQYACSQIMAASADWVCKIAKRTRTDLQNRKMHPMLKDIQTQVPGMETYSTDDIKLRFLNLLGTEMRFLPTLEGEGMFPVGLKSSTLTVAQFSALVELLYMKGAEWGVVWSEPKDKAA